MGRVQLTRPPLSPPRGRYPTLDLLLSKRAFISRKTAGLGKRPLKRVTSRISNIQFVSFLESQSLAEALPGMFLKEWFPAQFHSCGFQDFSLRFVKDYLWSLGGRGGSTGSSGK